MDDDKIVIDEAWRSKAAEEFIEFLKACPHVVPEGIGIEKFEQELEKALDKYVIFKTKTTLVDKIRYL
jgi:hypothetical protein